MTDTTLAQERPGTATATTAVTGRHLPALNGLRGVAVIGVVAYHLQLGWAQGGYLGVDLFFVLSGFLITTLLLEEWVGIGRIDLAAFWGRRARRLLPALFLVVAALALYLVCNALFGGPGANGLIDLSGLRGDAIATLLYVNNWHLIYAHQSYFAQFSTPSPLQHTWSLAIEEQFYLVWPLVLLLLLRLARGAAGAAVGVVVTVALGVGSSLLMAAAVPPRGGSLADLLRHRHPVVRSHGRGHDRVPGGVTPSARAQGAQRVLHMVGPAAAVVLAVFWVRGRDAGRPADRTSCSKGASCSAPRLAGLVVADARLVEPGLVRPRADLSAAALHRHHLLRHLPVALAGDRLSHRGADRACPPCRWTCSGSAVTLALSTASYYLVERPIRLARLRGGARFWGAPLAGVLTAVLIVVATIPAVADPATVVGTTHLAVRAGRGSPCRASAATRVRSRSTWTRAVPGRPAARHDPGRLGHARRRPTASPPHSRPRARPRCTPGPSTGSAWKTASNWPTSIPNLIRQTQAQLIVATWSWDEYGPTTPNALHQPVQYTKLLRRAVSVMLTPGNGVEGVIFTQFPQSGELAAANPADQVAYNNERRAGVVAWNDIARKMTSYFPGRVMYLPLADSVLLDGKFSAWLPPEGNPHAPNSAWIRVRKLDNVHLCPEGSARYADALLTDMTSIFGLAPAVGDWSQGSWTSDPNFNNPPGACPDDHPPG